MLTRPRSASLVVRERERERPAAHQPTSASRLYGQVTRATDFLHSDLHLLPIKRHITWKTTAITSEQEQMKPQSAAFESHGTIDYKHTDN